MNTQTDANVSGSGMNAELRVIRRGRCHHSKTATRYACTGGNRCNRGDSDLKVILFLFLFFF